MRLSTALEAAYLKAQEVGHQVYVYSTQDHPPDWKLMHAEISVPPTKQYIVVHINGREVLCSREANR